MQDFDWREFIRLTPTPETAKLLINHRLILKESSQILSVIGKVDQDQNALIGISQHEFFQFYIIWNDPDFINYTPLEVTGNSYLFISNHPLLDYLPDFVDIDTKPINANHLVDKNVLANNMKDSAPLPNKCIGVISIASKSTFDDLSLIENDGTLKPSQHFTIHFENRSTYWKYILKSGEALITEEMLPLTKNGFITITEDHLTNISDYETIFPNPNSAKFTTEDGKTYSEIFINY
ncbi:hypothetical protein ACFSKL_14985 [Belliella marina]|uniref:Uncharacterized protein n=2 Tax=Belliella marina TaxID=1644146 RepID=A0ABW4VTD9_9BACT